MDFDETMARYHQAANAFAEGDPEPIKALLSDRDDIMLANPFGPAVFGREKVAEALEYAASRSREGEVTAFEAIAKYVTIDLASSMSWSGGAPRLLAETRRPSSTCVTSTFRREGDTWKLVHRHADPITTPDPDGPLSGSGK